MVSGAGLYERASKSNEMQREPAADLPAEPLIEEQAQALLEREGVQTVWVMEYEENTRDLALEGQVADDAILDVVLETGNEYEMYSYADYEGETMWVSFGVEEKRTDGGEMMQETLESYSVLATAEER